MPQPLGDGALDLDGGPVQAAIVPAVHDDSGGTRSWVDATAYRTVILPVTIAIPQVNV